MVLSVERDMESNIKRWISSKEILAVIGPRQCGKTTLLLRLKEDTTVSRLFKKVIYISFEDDFEKSKFEKDPKGYVEYLISGDTSKYLLLLDEVQYVSDAGKKLKLVYDSFPNLKVVISGSSSLDLRDVGKMLVGRVIFFDLFPFSFGEFLKAKDTNAYSYYLKNKFNLNLSSIGNYSFLDILNKYLEEYLIFGGYPRVVLEKDVENKKVLLKNLFLTYVEKDVVKLYGDKFRSHIHGIVKYLASIKGSVLNYNDMASLNNVSFKELKEIIHILEDTFVIKLVKPFHKNMITELKKNPKVYFIDLGFRNFIADRFFFSDDEKGFLLENYVLNCLRGKNVFYWRTTAKAEVDFVLSDDIIPIEVKVIPKISRSFRSFLKSYKPKNAFMINLMQFYKVDLDGSNVFVVPASLIDF